MMRVATGDVLTQPATDRRVFAGGVSRIDLPNPWRVTRSIDHAALAAFAHASTLSHAAFTVSLIWASLHGKSSRDCARVLMLKRERFMIPQITRRRGTSGWYAHNDPKPLDPSDRLNRRRSGPREG